MNLFNTDPGVYDPLTVITFYKLQVYYFFLSAEIDYSSWYILRFYVITCSFELSVIKLVSLIRSQNLDAALHWKKLTFTWIVAKNN